MFSRITPLLFALALIVSGPLPPGQFKGNVIGTASNDYAAFILTDRGEIGWSRDSVKWEVIDFNEATGVSTSRYASWESLPEQPAWLSSVHMKSPTPRQCSFPQGETSGRSADSLIRRERNCSNSRRHLLPSGQTWNATNSCLRAPTASCFSSRPARTATGRNTTEATSPIPPGFQSDGD